VADTVPLERRPRHFGGYSFYFRGPGLRGTGCGRRVSCGPPGAPFDTGPVKGQVGTRANSARRFFARQRRCRSVAVSGFRAGRSPAMISASRFLARQRRCRSVAVSGFRAGRSPAMISASRFLARQRHCRSVAVSGFPFRDGRSRLGLGTSPASIASTPLNGMAVYTNSSTQTRLH